MNKVAMNETSPHVIPLEDHALLIERWQRGDERAMRQLFMQHHTRSYRLAIALVGNQADAEDIAQQSLIDGLLSPEKYNASRGGLSTWLAAIVVNNCRQQQRKHKRLGEILQRWFTQRRVPITPRPAPDEACAHEARAAMVRQALEELSPLLREAIVLRLWGEHSYKEIAQITGCPLRTAQSRVRLAIDELRHIIPAHVAQDLGVNP